MKTDREKLERWKSRLTANETAYHSELAKMDEREEIYRGDRTMRPVTDKDTAPEGGERIATHVCNIVAENIESEVDSNVPMPKVRARRQEDELKANLIEHMVRNELDRLPSEEINDLLERMVPIQGGGFLLVEWDNTLTTPKMIGDVAISAIHPKQVIPQDGVYSGIEDMDYIILRVPQTKTYIKRMYGVDVADEAESEPQVKGSVEADTAADMVTQYIAYWRNEKGGIGLYSWVNDIQLVDIEDYQARRLRRCKKCGALEIEGLEALDEPTTDGTYPGGDAEEIGTEPEEAEPKQKTGAGRCKYCGSRAWEESEEDFEEIYIPHTTEGGRVIPGATEVTDEMGVIVGMQPTRIPYYKPNVYPIIQLKNVSVFGRFLGDSDVDKIADQQNTLNRVSKKILDRLIGAGTRITLPDDPSCFIDTEDNRIIRIGSAADKALIGSYDFSGDLEYEMTYYSAVYEEARRILGITDSFQGRKDTTATSGKAKEFAAAQSAGRLQSKRVMKDAAWARLFELIFKFRLAYADEPRPVYYTDENGDTKYDMFDRYDFLEQDETGEWHWNDQFLFSCDSSAPLANNQTAMWQETTTHLQAGAYGDPTQIDTLILYWTKMELLHYPGASETKKYLEAKRERELAQQAQMQQMQMMQAQRMEQQAINQARMDAQRARGGMMNGNV